MFLADESRRGEFEVHSEVSPEWIASRIDRLPGTVSLWKLVLLISLGGWFELYDLFLTGYIAPGLAKSGLLTLTTEGYFGFYGIGAFIAATFAGLFIGTFCLGFLPDRLGRRFVFTYALLWYTVAAAAMACQISPGGILVWRFVAGIGVGLEIITIDAYLIELMPERLHGRTFAFNQAIMFSAVPVVALLSWQVVPYEPFGVQGWRWVVLFGSLGAVIIWFIRRAIPESALWLAQQGRGNEAVRILSDLEARAIRALGQPLPAPLPSRVSIREVTADLSGVFRAPYRFRLITLVVFNICQVIGYYGFANWVPTLLLANGVGVTESLAYSAVIAIANPIGPLIALSFADRIDRKWVIVSSAFTVTVVGAGFSYIAEPSYLIACGALITLANTILSCAYHAYQVEIFPVSIRARAGGIAYSFSRLAATSSGFLIAFFLKEFGVSGVFGLISACMVAVMLVIGIFGPSRKSLRREAHS